MKIQLLDKTYKVIDAKEKITIADSFVLTSNKIGTAHGEGKLYIGNGNKETYDFFWKKRFYNKLHFT